MIIRAIKTYLVCMLFVGGMYIVTSCSREEGPLGNMEEEAGKPIELLALPQWPDQTKAPINGVGDLLGSGFVVWGAWAQDPADNAQFSGDYSSGTTNKVFGQNGTKVYATDGDGNGTFAPVAYTGSSNSGQIDHWAYSPTRYWHRGTYNFAAVLPEGDFGASYGKDGAETGYTGGLAINTSGNPVLTIDFGESGFRLGENEVSGTSLPKTAQMDLMYAFSNVDNTKEDKIGVTLNFLHTCAQLRLKFKSDAHDKNFDIQSITIYGIHNSITAPIAFTSVENDNISAIRELLANPTTSVVSTEESPFATFLRPAAASDNGNTENNNGNDWSITGDAASAGVLLVEKLIVFPELLSETNSLKIKVGYTTNNVNKTLVATIQSGEWLPNKIYTYTLAVDAIEIGEPEVTPWAEPRKDIDYDIE